MSASMWVCAVPRQAAVLLAMLVCGPLCPSSIRAWGQDCFRWIEVTPAPALDPEVRVRQAMAYDGTRDVLVLFGGRAADGTALGDTWEWDGATWALKAQAGPEARYDSYMVFDAARGVCLLYGGRAADNTLRNDTWMWDGLAWVELTPVNNPGARDSHAMVYDSGLQTVLLFGGWGGAPSDELWAWDGTDWTLRLTGGPAARYWHNMAYDVAHGETVLFGGYDGTNPIGDTWLYTSGANTWTPVFPAQSPPARSGPAMTYAPTHGVVLFGGSEPTQYFGDAWVWDGVNWTEVAGNPPYPRWRATAAHLPISGKTAVFGGAAYAGMVYNDLWEWDGLAWAPAVNATPGLRWGMKLSFDVGRAQTVLFGGDVAGYQSDTWEWDGSEWRFRTAGGPAGRGLHAQVYYDYRGVTFVFGGIDGSGQYLDDTWQWDGAVWTQLFPTTSPSRRANMAFAFDYDRGVMVLFGGFDGTNRLGDTWEWDGVDWTLRATGGPTLRAGAGMAYDFFRGVAVLFGGRDDVARQGDTWEWDGNTWTQVANSGPSPREPTWLVYDDARRVCLLFGGASAAGPDLNDTWAWDGTAWRQLANAGPSPRENHAATYDYWRALTVMFGGYDNTVSRSRGDTWESELLAPGIFVDPADQTVIEKKDAHFSVSAGGASPLGYQWRKDGGDLSDGGRISGSKTAALTISAVVPPDAGLYDVRVSNTCGTVLSRAAALVVRRVGDLNCDGNVNNFDIDPFVLALTDPVGYAQKYPNCDRMLADCNGDGVVNNFDIDPFVKLLTP